MAYTPIPEEKLHDYGELPENSGDVIAYPLSSSNIPTNATEVLIYIWATTKGDEEFHRYYYRIQTTDGQNYYNQYMNVAATRDVSLNSANLWLPVFNGHGEVVVTLIDAEEPTKKGKSIAYRGKRRGASDVITFSEFFVLGYRS